ncbi:MAG: Na/Pi cotransporter family protein [Mycoplasmatales bacterium]
MEKTITLDTMNLIFGLIGGLGIFLYGIKMMGESLKAYAGDNLSNLINKYTTNPFKGLLVGILATVLIQSSSGTTALTISLVRAGLMNFRQAIGIIMGANIGTTVTAFLIGLAIKDYALPIMLVGALIFMFSSKKKTSLIGQIVFGFGALFFGISLMEIPLKALADTPQFASVMQNVAKTPFLGIIIGACLTMLVQSSSATIGILQALCVSGQVQFSVAVAILLGDNIGTTITSLLASLGGSKDSKRAALSHVFFNVIGSVAFYIILYIFGGIAYLEQLKDWLRELLNLNVEMQVAVIHLIFNLTVAFTLIWFVAQIEKLIKFIIPVTEDEKKIELSDNFLDDMLLHESPSLGLEQGRQGLVTLAETVVEQLENTAEYIKTNSENNKSKVLQLEIAVNILDKKLKSFFSEVMSEDLSDQDSRNLNTYMYSINEFERIGDIAEKVTLLFEQQKEEKSKISAEAKEEVLKMLKVATSAVKKSLQMLKTGDLTLAEAILEKEKDLDKMERKYYKEHLKRVKEGTCSGKISVLYVDLISDIERMGDHTENLVEYFTNVNQILTEVEEEFDIAKILS